MDYSQTISLRLTKQSSTLNLTTTLKNEFENLPFVNHVKVYRVFSLEKNLYDKNTIEIYDHTNKVLDPYWLAYWPKNEYEFTNPIRIKSADNLDNEQIDLYLLKESGQTLKLVELHSQQATEADM